MLTKLTGCHIAFLSPAVSVKVLALKMAESRTPGSRYGAPAAFAVEFIPSPEQSPDHISCRVNSKSHTLLACSMKTQGRKLVRKCEKEKPTLGSRGLMGPRAHRCTGKKNGGGAEEQASGDKSLPSCRFTVLE